MIKLRLAVACLALVGVSSLATAEEVVKIGYASTLSGPTAAIGGDIKDGFDLFLKSKDGKLGNLKAEVIVTDNGLKVDAEKQNVNRLLKREKVDFMTGGVFGAMYMPVLPEILASETFYLAPNSGLKDYAGAKCSPYLFTVGFQNEDHSPGMAKYMNGANFKSIYLVAAAGPGGREVLDGFKRHYKGAYEEMFTKLGQVDYAAEIATIRAAKPDAIFTFLPGGMGISFMKQYVSAGLNKDIPVYMPGYNADEDSLKSLGEVLLGTLNTSHWAHDLDNAANKKFVEAFTANYKRLPSMYAAQGYDVAQLIDSAVKAVKGNLSDKAAVRKALEAADFESVRGHFEFNKNHMPIHDIYMREVVKNDAGIVTNRTIAKVVEKQKDPFVGDCNMPG